MAIKEIINTTNPKIYHINARHIKAIKGMLLRMKLDADSTVGTTLAILIKNDSHHDKSDK